MSRSQVLKAEIATHLGPGPSERGKTALRSITDLFINRATDYSHEQVAVFDEVMQCLLDHTAHDAKVELSSRLAPIPRAPAKIVGTLLKDKDPAVSLPLLRQSPAVSDADLNAFAKSGAPEVLMIVAKRSAINKQVSDELLARNIPDINRAVLTNAGAEISESSFVKLIGECENDASLCALLGNRKDLPEELRPFLDAYKPKGKAPRKR